jgi:hypothetical protein
MNERETYVDFRNPVVDGVKDLGLKLGIALLGEAGQSSNVHVVGRALRGSFRGCVLPRDWINLVDARQGPGKGILNITQHLCTHAIRFRKTLWQSGVTKGPSRWCTDNCLTPQPVPAPMPSLLKNLGEGVGEKEGHQKMGDDQLLLFIKGGAVGQPTHERGEVNTRLRESDEVLRYIQSHLA